MQTNGSRVCAAVPRRQLGREAWDAVADASEDGWLWHLDALGAALDTWPGATDLSFALVDRDGRTAAIVPLTHFAATRLRGRVAAGLTRSLGGPAVADWVTGRARERVRAEALEHAADRAERHGAIVVEVTLSPLAPALRGDSCPRVNPLCALGLENTLGQTWMVDLRAGVEDVWKGLKTRARGEIRKAERAGVTVRLADGLPDLDAYCALHAETYGRTGATPHPRAYFEVIWRDLVSSGRATVFVAELDGEPIAARNYGTYKRGGLYWTGAASERGLETGAGSLLQWHAMRWLVEHGYEWSETGEAFPGATDEKSRGLDLHKASFGGELFPLYRGSRRLHRRMYEVVDALGRLRKAVHA